jgi:putative FmdB family regulatory protein
MPIYEYACQSCGHTFDALQKMSAEPLTDCPECGEQTLKKLLSAPNFRLKGSGWYETDFKKENRRNLVDGTDKKGSTSDADSKKDAGSEKKGDSKAPAKDVKKSETGSKKPAGGKSGSI